MMKFQKTLGALLLIFIAFSCEQSEELQKQQPIDGSPIFRDLPSVANGRKPSSNSKYTVLSAEYITSGESGKIGRTIYFKNVGNKQLTADFVPGTSSDGTDNVSYYIDQRRPSADLSVAKTTAAIGRAMTTWENLTCSELGMYQIPSQRRLATGFVSELFGFSGSYEYVADVVHSGWLPGAFFDLVDEDGSEYILAVTYTIIITEDDGTPTDLDSDGKADVAWREIYYNEAFAWADGAHYDVETIALHEAGHGLSQGHFGAAFLDAGTGKLHFSPRAVMNAAYSGIQTGITETDNAGHCSNWSNWPNN
jgi:hypothetical protein